MNTCKCIWKYYRVLGGQQAKAYFPVYPEMALSGGEIPRSCSL